jgi:nitrogen fixation protein NifT
MIRQTADGKLSFYVAKKDLEETIVSLQFESDEKWGGEVVLSDGSKFFIEPVARPKLPTTLRANRA